MKGADINKPFEIRIDGLKKTLSICTDETPNVRADTESRLDEMECLWDYFKTTGVNVYVLEMPMEIEGPNSILSMSLSKQKLEKDVEKIGKNLPEWQRPVIRQMIVEVE